MGRRGVWRHSWSLHRRRWDGSGSCDKAGRYLAPNRPSFRRSFPLAQINTPTPRTTHATVIYYQPQIMRIEFNQRDELISYQPLTQDATRQSMSRRYRLRPRLVTWTTWPCSPHFATAAMLQRKRQSYVSRRPRAGNFPSKTVPLLHPMSGQMPIWSRSPRRSVHGEKAPLSRTGSVTW